MDPRDPALPDSGDGLAPPRPEALPHPEMWSDPPAGTTARPFQGKAEDDAEVPDRSRARMLTIYGAVATIIVATVLVGVAFVQASLVLVVVGVVLGAIGATVAWKAQILTLVSIGDSPTGPG